MLCNKERMKERGHGEKSPGEKISYQKKAKRKFKMLSTVKTRKRSYILNLTNTREKMVFQVKEQTLPGKKGK